jgi:HEAT repeat protein
MEWSAIGKPMGSRQAAIGAVAELDKTNKDITRMLISFLNEPYYDVRIAAIFALAARGDTDAIAPLEDLLRKGELTVAIGPYIELALRLLRAQPAPK